MHELIEEGLKDMYNAEKQLTKALPKLAKLAKSERLKAAFEEHLSQTENHIQRIEQACESMGIKPSGMACKGMKGIIEEGNEHLKGMKRSAMTDAALIAAAQKTEHYEIAMYGTLCEWTKLMGDEHVLELLKLNLDEEEMTDQLLTEIAETEVNSRAMEEENSKPNGKARSTKRTSSRTQTVARSRSSSSRSPRGRASMR